MRLRDAEPSEIRVAAKDFHVVGCQVTWEGVCIGRVCVLGGCVRWEGVCVRKEGNVFSASEVQLNTYSHFIRSVYINHRCDCHHGYKTS